MNAAQSIAKRVGAAITEALRRPSEPDLHCRQCWRSKPHAQFIGARGAIVIMCAECRERYGNWANRTLAQRLAARAPVERTGDGLHVALVLASKNRKTGPIPVSMTDMASCPPSCPHMDAGCYAGYGKAAHHWRTVPDRGVRWGTFCLAIADLPEGTLWRHNEAGDLPGRGDALNIAALDALVVANEGRRGFTFTHKPLRRAEERKAVALANARGFTINLSANSLEHADELAELGIGPVVVVLPSDAPMKMTTPSGRKVIVCPAETSGLTCSTCGLCSKPQRKAIVGFRAHGQARAIVSDLVQLRRKEAAA